MQSHHYREPSSQLASFQAFQEHQLFLHIFFASRTYQHEMSMSSNLCCGRKSKSRTTIILSNLKIQSNSHSLSQFLSNKWFEYGK